MDEKKPAFDFEEALRNLPQKPGVYMHKDASGEIIYVGKARSLKNRVRQYFQSRANMDPKVRKMVSHIAEFQYIITGSEMEALLLESHLIKRYMPKYNVLLRDDKSFPYIRLTMSEPYPRLLKSRQVVEDGSLYFGPYVDASVADKILELLNDMFSLKRCRAVAFPEGFTPCLNYHLNRCRGICSGQVSKEEYMKAVEGAKAFLEGNTKDVLEYLKQRMNAASEAMEYEQAAVYRDHMRAVMELPDQAQLDRFMESMGENRVLVDGEKSSRDRRRDEGERKAVCKALADFAGCEKAERIEAYDISHTAGLLPVGVMAVFSTCIPQRKAHRRFRIKSAAGGDDYAALQETIYRRMKRAQDGDPAFLPLPDLLLIDGGEKQAAAVETVLSAMSLAIPVVGMVKDDHHRSRGLVCGEKVMELRDNRGVFKAVGRMQEEVHRLAVEYHRGLREQGLQKSALDKVPGIGPKRKLLLLTTFGSVEEIAKASPEEIREKTGIPADAAQNLAQYLQTFRL